MLIQQSSAVQRIFPPPHKKKKKTLDGRGIPNYRNAKILFLKLKTVQYFRLQLLNDTVTFFR